MDDIKGQMNITQRKIDFSASKPNSNPPQSLKISLDFSDILSIRKPGKLNLLVTHVIYIRTKHDMKFNFGGFLSKDYEDCFDIIHKIWETEVQTLDNE